MVEKNKIAMAQIWLGAKPDFKETVLRQAIEEDDSDLVEKLLVAGANPNATNKSGETALHLAAQYGSPKSVEKILATGANLHATDKYGHTALHFAAEYGSSESAEKMLDAGANVDATENTGRTALHFAAQYGHKDTVNKLVIASLKKHIEEKKAARSENEHPTHSRFDFGQKRPSVGKQIAAIEALIGILEQGGNPENLLEEHHKKELTNSDVKELYNTAIKYSKEHFIAKANDEASDTGYVAEEKQSARF